MLSPFYTMLYVCPSYHCVFKICLFFFQRSEGNTYYFSYTYNKGLYRIRFCHSPFVNLSFFVRLYSYLNHYYQHDNNLYMITRIQNVICPDLVWCLVSNVDCLIVLPSLIYAYWCIMAITVERVLL